MITPRIQRWRARRGLFIPAAPEIDPRRPAADIIDTRRNGESSFPSGAFPPSAIWDGTSPEQYAKDES